MSAFDKAAFVAAVLILDLAAAHAFVAWFTRRVRRAGGSR